MKNDSTTCPICRTRKLGAPTYNLEQSLKELGFTGRAAHPRCIIDYKAKLEKQARKRGINAVEIQQAFIG